MKKVLQMASAFIGIIIGAGFASGQEILQYFTSFGLLGTIAIIIATALFAYVGMILTRLGSRMRANNHSDVIYKISGKFIGRIIDYILVAVLIGVGVVMIAGGGSTLNQQFGLPFWVGALLMVVLLSLAAVNDVSRVVNIIGSITPFLIISVVLVAIYTLFTMDGSFSQLSAIAAEQPKALPNWALSAVNYVSFNIAVGASMSIVMGGDEKDEKTAALGGLFGGLGIGVLILLSHYAILANIELVAGVDMPMLKIVDELSPILGFLYSLILFGMVFNTGLSMFYSFGARFAHTGTKKFKMITIGSIVAGFGLSFVGFTSLVSIFYPLFGYLGLVLCAVLIVASFRIKKYKALSAEQKAA
ncbi:YkvI family membrane protein [Bacillus tuaregi]|uniref:YkvI family membrane protein n=1 Tax=Bacillus tuaregi TaxID=1816695 RepID=UPI0008F88D75|nr:hypothetical protein [Bacillus tuaregi]